MCSRCENDYTELWHIGSREPVRVPNKPCEHCGRSQHRHNCCQEGRRLAALIPCGICGPEYDCGAVTREIAISRLEAISEQYKDQVLPKHMQAEWDYLVAKVDAHAGHYRSGRALTMRNIQTELAVVAAAFGRQTALDSQIYPLPGYEQVCSGCRLTIDDVDWVTETRLCWWCDQLAVIRKGEAIGVRVPGRVRIIPLEPMMIMRGPRPAVWLAALITWLVISAVAITLIATVVA